MTAYEKSEYVKAIRKTIKDLKSRGTVSMGERNLYQCVSPSRAPFHEFQKILREKKMFNGFVFTQE